MHTKQIEREKFAFKKAGKRLCKDMFFIVVYLRCNINVTAFN